MSGGWEKSSAMIDALNKRIDDKRERDKERTALEEAAGPTARIRVYRRNNNSNNA